MAWPSRRAEERGERREERGGRGRGAAMRQASGVQDQVTSPLHGTPTPFTASSAWSPQHALPLLLLLLLRPASRINQDTLCLASHCVQNLRQYCRIIHRKQQQQQQQQPPPPHDHSWPSQLQQTPFPRLSPVSYRCRQQQQQQQQQQQPHVVAERNAVTAPCHPRLWHDSSRLLSPPSPSSPLNQFAPSFFSPLPYLI